MEYRLTAAQLDAVARHEYRGTDHSLIGRYVMQPYWSAAVQLLPRWLAPNVVTLLGGGAVVLCFLVLLATGYARDAYAPWMWWLVAAAVFFYQTMDAIDGKQARRTGNSSPLGDILDHGTDVVVLGVINALTLLMVDYPFTPYLVLPLCVLGQLTCYSYQWEMSRTRTMTFGIVSGPTEGNLLIVAMGVITALFGRAFWAQPIGALVPFATPAWLHALLAIELRDFVVGCGVLFFVFETLGNFSAVSKVVGGVRAGVRDAVHELLPSWVFGLCVVGWSAVDAAGIREAPFLALSTMLMMFAELNNRQLVARISRVPRANVGLVQLLVVVLTGHGVLRLAGLRLLHPALVYGAVLAVTLVVYLSVARTVVQQICAHLGIRPFTVKPPARAD